MTYKQLEILIPDARFQELKFRQEQTNIFTIVGQTHTEHWHSSFLSWLLDAQENYNNSRPSTITTTPSR